MVQVYARKRRRIVPSPRKNHRSRVVVQRRGRFVLGPAGEVAMAVLLESFGEQR
jgi:hypothetical protein